MAMLEYADKKKSAELEESIKKRCDNGFFAVVNTVADYAIVTKASFETFEEAKEYLLSNGRNWYQSKGTGQIQYRPNQKDKAENIYERIDDGLGFIEFYYEENKKKYCSSQNAVIWNNLEWMQGGGQ